MTDAFEKWINSMSDDEYEDMLDESNPNGFSDAQQEKALNIREAPTQQELEDFELEQEFIEEPTIDKEKVFTGKRITISEPSLEPTIEPTIDISGSTAQRIPTPIPIERPTVKAIPKPRAITQAIKTAVSSAGKFIRRFFRV
jgi:hypothetical protein